MENGKATKYGVTITTITRNCENCDSSMRVPNSKKKRFLGKGFSLIEMLAVLTIAGMLAALAMHYVLGASDEINKNSCHVTKGNIEVQAELYLRNNGTWPTVVTLSADSEYFPEGISICPRDGTPYILDTSTHQIVGHNH